MSEQAKVRYGRKKLDAEAYEQQETEARESTREATRFGSRKFQTEKPAPVKGRGARTRTTGDDPKGDAGNGQEKEPPRTPTGSLPSIAKLRELLTKSPGQLDAAIEVEMKQEKPRKGALQLFLEVEEGKGDDARAETVAKIGAALAAFEE